MVRSHTAAAAEDSYLDRPAFRFGLRGGMLLDAIEARARAIALGDKWSDRDDRSVAVGAARALIGGYDEAAEALVGRVPAEIVRDVLRRYAKVTAP